MISGLDEEGLKRLRAKADELEADEDDELSAFRQPRQRQSGGAMDRD